MDKNGGEFIPITSQLVTSVHSSSLSFVYGGLAGVEYLLAKQATDHK